MSGALVMTHGLPGSGKSTLADRFRRIYGDSVLVAERDEIRELILPPSYHLDGYDPVSELQVSAVQVELIEEGLSLGKIVVASDTNLADYRVHDLVAIARRFDAEVFHAHFDLTLDECERRNEARAAAGGRLVPRDVIADMAVYGYEGGRIKFYSVRSFGSEPRDFEVSIRSRTGGEPSLEEELEAMDRRIVAILGSAVGSADPASAPHSSIALPPAGLSQSSDGESFEGLEAQR